MALKKKRKAVSAGGPALDDEESAPAAEPSTAPAADDAGPRKKKKRRLAPPAEASEPAVEAAGASDASGAAEAPLSRGVKKKKRRAAPPAEAGEPVAEAAEASEAAGTAEAPMSRGVKKTLKAKAKKAAATAESASAAPGADEAAGDGKDHTVFVDGVPYTWEVEKIREIFSRCGQVLEVRAPTWQDSGRLRGFAHVSFASQEAKAEALKMSGIKVGAKGRFLKIDAAKRPDEGKPKPQAQDLAGKRRLFVKNLPYDATEEEIRKLFSKFGKVLDIRIPMSFGRSKGFGYVEFAKAEMLKRAVEEGADLKGRKLLLDADGGEGPKAGFHYRPGAIEGMEEAHGRGRGGKGKGGKGFGKDKGKGKFLGRGRGPSMPLF